MGKTKMEFPYLSRPEAESFLRERFQARLKESGTGSGVLVLQGQRGIGEMEIISHVLTSDPMFNQYKVFSINFDSKTVSPEDRSSNVLIQSLKAASHFGSSYGSVGIKLLSVLYKALNALGFPDDLIEKFDEKAQNPEELFDFILHELCQKVPVILICEEWDKAAVSWGEFICRIADNLYNSNRKLLIILFSDMKGERDSQGALMLKKLRYKDESIEYFKIDPPSLEETGKYLINLGITNESIVKTLYSLSFGLIEPLKTILQHLEESHVLSMNEDRSWAMNGYGEKILKDEVNNSINRILEQRLPETKPEFHSWINLGFFLASSMGDHFLPKLIADIVYHLYTKYEKEDSGEHDISPDDLEEIWYDCLEKEGENYYPLVKKIDGEVESSIIRDDDDVSYFVYEFTDTFFIYIVRQRLKEHLSDKKSRYYNGVKLIEQIFKEEYSKNWEFVTPFLLNLYEIQDRWYEYESLESLQNNIRLLNELPLRIEEAKKDVSSVQKAWNLYRLIQWLGDIHEKMGDYRILINLSEEALSILINHKLDNKGREEANARDSLGYSYYLNGIYKKALEELQKALKIREIALPPNHPDIGEIHNNIGLVLHSMGRLKEALKENQKALKIYNIALPPNHPYIGTSHNNIGLVLNSLGRLEEALKESQKALKISEIALPPNHPDIGTSHNNIGYVLRFMGRLEEALKEYQKALKIFEIAPPPDHPYIIDIQEKIKDIRGKI